MANKKFPDQSEIHNELESYGISRTTKAADANVVELNFAEKNQSALSTKAFYTLLDIYGVSLWTKEHGKKPSDKFCATFDRLGAECMSRVFRAAQIQLQKGNVFPPPLGQLVTWAHTPTEDEYYDMLSRVMGRKYNNEIEHWLVVYARRDLKLCRHDEQLKILKQRHRYAVELERQGNLFAQEKEILSLPPASAVSEVDKHLQETKIDPDVRFSVKARIDRLKRAQAAQPKNEKHWG